MVLRQYCFNKMVSGHGIHYIKFQNSNTIPRNVDKILFLPSTIKHIFQILSTPVVYFSRYLSRVKTICSGVQILF